jgi:hypothetical protein
MKKLFAILALVALAPISGCITGGDDGGDSSGGAGIKFLPLKPGASWTYDTVIDYGSTRITGTYTESVLGTQAVEDLTYWLVEDRYFNGLGEYSNADSALVRIEGNVVYTLFPEFPSAKIALKVAKPADILKTTVLTTGIASPFLKFGLSAGQSWVVYDTGNQNGSHILVTGKSLGTETVQVDAGTFKNCAKFQIVNVMAYSSTDYTYTSTNTSYLWFAPDVGLVRQDDTSVTASGTGAYGYTRTVTLTSYMMPE